jgi:hypothetical protein
MLDRAILLLRKEYPITPRHVADRLERGRSRSSTPRGLAPQNGAKSFNAPGRVALRIEADRNKGDLGAEQRSQRVLVVDHLLSEQRANVRMSGQPGSQY